MLKKLFSSSIRADVLSLLLNSPGEMFYVREIARLLRKNPSGVKRELDHLEKMGIVISERVANLRYFHANTESELYNELKDLVTKSLGLPGALKAMLRAAGAESAFIYGPYAEGEETDAVNIFVVGAQQSIEKDLRDLKKKFGYTIQCAEMGAEEFAAKKKKKDAGLMKTLAKKRIRLLGKI